MRMKIRTSIATASLLKLKKCKINVEPSTIYFLMDGKCNANCIYCEQKKGYLARVKWIPFNLEEIVKNIEKAPAKRICIQSIYGNEYFKDLLEILEVLRKFDKPISISINAIEEEKMKILKEKGVDRIGIGIDCFTKEIFYKWKKKVPSWEEYIKALKNAKRIFGKVTCHLIVGLGESDKEAIKFMKKLSKEMVTIALFAYTKNKKPVVELPRYRCMQIARYFLERNKGKFYFEDSKLIEMELPYLKKDAFLTSGCPDCNRPFYNESIRKIYNYPYEISDKEAKKSYMEAMKYAKIHITT